MQNGEGERERERGVREGARKSEKERQCRDGVCIMRDSLS